MKKNCLLILGLLLANSGFSQKTMSLEECRQMALENNKSLQIAKENVAIAGHLKKAAMTQYLPNFSANGLYMWNQKNISLLAEDGHLPIGQVGSDGSFGFRPDQVNNEWTTINGNPVPLDKNGNPFDPHKNPEKIEWKDYALLPKEELEYDVKNVFAGTIGFAQPVYMGGKIRELNKMAKYGVKLANIKSESATSDLLLEVDEAYWRVVSVQAKFELAKSYRELVAKVNTEVNYLIEQGLATKSDLLKVKVKLNEAELTMTRAENGLNLSKMALNQICGLELDAQYNLSDYEQPLGELKTGAANIEHAIDSRDEIQALEQVKNLAESNTRLARSRFLPNIGLTAGYMVSNPNVYNGFSNTFAGMFNAGVVVNVPLFHFGEKIHTLKASKSQAKIVELQIEEAREKIELQITQSSYRVSESIKKQQSTLNNIASAEENLRMANEGFREGVISSTDLLGAQTAWVSAKSDNIDANIEVKLCALYLDKALGGKGTSETK